MIRSPSSTRARNALAVHLPETRADNLEMAQVEAAKAATSQEKAGAPSENGGPPKEDIIVPDERSAALGEELRRSGVVSFVPKK